MTQLYRAKEIKQSKYQQHGSLKRGYINYEYVCGNCGYNENTSVSNIISLKHIKECNRCHEENEINLPQYF